MRRHGQPILAQRWRSLAVTAVLLVLAGAVVLVWLRIDQESSARQAATAEADLRGDAVTTLAGDVRVLREQIKAKGGTPAVPDPSSAVEDLPARAEVPVPIPGPTGARGPEGEPGKPAPTVIPSPGAPGSDGRDGTDGADGAPGEPGDTVTGPPGAPGRDGSNGTDGKDGKDGRDGQTCPDGYSLQAPSWDPDALVCRRDGAPPPNEPDPSPSPLALPAERRRIA